MEINFALPLSVFALVAAVTIAGLIILQRKITRSGPPLTLRQRWQNFKAQQVAVNLMINKFDHDHIINHYRELCDQYAECVSDGELVSDLLTEKMQSFYASLDHQIKGAVKMAQSLPPDDQAIITDRYHNWREIQQELQVMMYPAVPRSNSEWPR